MFRSLVADLPADRICRRAATASGCPHVGCHLPSGARRHGQIVHADCHVASGWSGHRLRASAHWMPSAIGRSSTRTDFQCESSSAIRPGAACGSGHTSGHCRPRSPSFRTCGVLRARSASLGGHELGSVCELGHIGCHLPDALPHRALSFAQELCRRDDSKLANVRSDQVVLQLQPLMRVPCIAQNPRDFETPGGGENHPLPVSLSGSLPQVSADAKAYFPLANIEQSRERLASKPIEPHISRSK